MRQLFIKMKSRFSKKWKSSKQPRKKRKYLANAPLHIKRKFLGATLSKELRKKFGRRSIEVRKGDEVKIMRGKFKKRQGKVAVVDVKNTRISIEGINITKKDGTKVNVWFHPSNVMITSLNLEDPRRFKREKNIQQETKAEVENAPEKK